MKLLLPKQQTDFLNCKPEIGFFSFLEPCLRGMYPNGHPKVECAGSFALSELIRYYNERDISFCLNDMDLYVYCRSLELVGLLQVIDTYTLSRNGVVASYDMGWNEWYRDNLNLATLKIAGVLTFRLIGLTNRYFDKTMQIILIEDEDGIFDMSQTQFAKHVVSSFDLDIVRVALLYPRPPEV
jgi:hypothetical protein